MAYDLPESGQVTVVDGQGTRGTASSLDYAALQVRAVVAGDFGGADTAPETAVFTNTNTGGTGQFSDVHVFTCSASTTQLVTSAGVGDRADDGVRAIALANGKLIIDRFADAKGACCPTAAIRQGYRLSGSTLTPSGPAAKRKIISLDIVGTADAIITFLPGTNGAVLFGDTSTAHAGGFDASAGQKLTLAIEASPPGTAAAIIDITTGGTVLASATSGGAVTITLPATGHYLLTPHAGPGGEDAAFDAEMTIV